MDDNSWNTELRKGVEHLRTVDEVMAELIAVYPFQQFQPHNRHYQELVESIISQQLSTASARAITKKFEGIWGTFPTPEQVFTIDDTVLRMAGLSRAKIRYIKDVSRHALEGLVDFENLQNLDNDEVSSQLLPIIGVGEWTCHMFLIFSLGRLNVLPVGDLGIRNAIARHYLVATQTASRVEVQETANLRKWHPYESIASWYLWQSLDNSTNQ